MVPRVKEMLRADDADDALKDDEFEGDELMKKLKKVRSPTLRVGLRVCLAMGYFPRQTKSCLRLAGGLGLVTSYSYQVIRKASRHRSAPLQSSPCLGLFTSQLERKPLKRLHKLIKNLLGSVRVLSGVGGGGGGCGGS